MTDAGRRGPDPEGAAVADGVGRLHAAFAETARLARLGVDDQRRELVDQLAVLETWHLDQAAAAWEERDRLLVGPTCPVCGSPIVRKLTGRPRIYCEQTAACRKAAQRQREASQAE